MKGQNIKIQNSGDLLKHEAEIAYGFLLQLRNTDLKLLWTRSVIFLAIEGGLLGFVLPNMEKNSIMLHLIGGYGVFIAIIWIIITHNGCSWLKAWEKQLKHIEDKVLPNSPDIPIFREDEDKKNFISIKVILRVVTYVNMAIWGFLFICSFCKLLN